VLYCTLLFVCLQLALNLEYLEAEFYPVVCLGVGLEGFNLSLTGGGPPLLGAQGQT